MRLAHFYVGDVYRPDLIGQKYTHIAQQIRKTLVFLAVF